MEDELKEDDVVAVPGRNSYYEIDDDNTTASYMLESMKDKVTIPTHDDTTFNPFVIRHAMTQDLDTTTFLMWMQAFSPLFAGMLVNNGVLRAVGLGFIGKYVMLCIFDAVFGLLDVWVLYRHDYDVKKLVLWSVWLPPVYMKMRSRLLREKNMHHVVWLIAVFILMIM